VWYLSEGYCIASNSRYVQRNLHWQTGNDDSCVSYLLDLADKYSLDGWVLYPGGDADGVFLSRNAERLETRYRVVASPWSVVSRLHNKRLAYELAEELGVDYPWTAYPGSRKDVESLDCAFPAILKPAVKYQSNAFTRAKAWRVTNRQELLRAYDRASSLVDPQTILVQELIPGTGATQFSYAALWKGPSALASLVARRSRQFPVDFGFTSTCVETIDRPEVERAASRILSAINYRGLVEVEFKYDGRDGRYKLLDINPRCWTWHALGQKAGVDFSYIAWLDAQGLPASRVQGRTGVRWVYASRDLAAAAIEMCRGRLSLTSYIRSLSGPATFPIFAADDVVPAFVELPKLFYRLWRRTMK
jgi:predicted ATP-grasp superfamily ATP-dependent carboligase